MITYAYQGLGANRVLYTLSTETFGVALPGPQLGKGLHEVAIPIAHIDGFYVKQPIMLGGVKGAAANAMARAARTGSGELLVSWRADGKSRSKRFVMVDIGDPCFRALVDALARLRPEADHRGLPHDQALAKLGMWSPQKISLVAIAAVLLFCVAVSAVVALRPA